MRSVLPGIAFAQLIKTTSSWSKIFASNWRKYWSSNGRVVSTLAGRFKREAWESVLRNSAGVVGIRVGSDVVCRGEREWTDAWRKLSLSRAYLVHWQLWWGKCIGRIGIIIIVIRVRCRRWSCSCCRLAQSTGYQKSVLLIVTHGFTSGITRRRRRCNLANGNRLFAIFSLSTGRSFGHSNLVASSETTRLTTLSTMLVNRARVRCWTDVFIGTWAIRRRT